MLTLSGASYFPWWHWDHLQISSLQSTELQLLLPSICYETDTKLYYLEPKIPFPLPWHLIEHNGNGYWIYCQAGRSFDHVGIKNKGTITTATNAHPFTGASGWGWSCIVIVPRVLNASAADRKISATCSRYTVTISFDKIYHLLIVQMQYFNFKLWCVGMYNQSQSYHTHTSYKRRNSCRDCKQIKNTFWLLMT